MIGGIVPVRIEAFCDAYQKALDEGVAAAFVGAGLSAPAGFVDWKELLREIATELDLNVDEETDLIALAQYHHNHARGRGRLNQKLIEEFTKDASPTENHHLLANLPLASVWTTNYDHLIEDAFTAIQKRVDKKVAHADLATTKPKRDVVVYKMHGDIDRPDEAVLTKADFERFDEQRHLFSVQLKGELLSKTMLFLGYSFGDPNVHYILARIRSLVGENIRPHYWITRDANKNAKASARDKRIQRHRIEDLKTYGIRTVLVDDYPEITTILRDLKTRVHRKNVFVSGSAFDYGALGAERSLTLLRRLGGALIDGGFNLVSGMGLGVGDAVAMGAIEAVYRKGGSHLDERTILRPFPQTEPGKADREAIWTRYRTEMLGRARSSIIVFGNKGDDGGKVVDAPGIIEEFKIARQLGTYPIPIGMTGFTARELSTEVLADLDAVYGSLAPQVKQHLDMLGNDRAKDDEIISSVLAILKTIAPK